MYKPYLDCYINRCNICNESRRKVYYLIPQQRVLVKKLLEIVLRNVSENSLPVLACVHCLKNIYACKNLMKSLITEYNKGDTHFSSTIQDVSQKKNKPLSSASAAAERNDMENDNLEIVETVEIIDPISIDEDIIKMEPGMSGMSPGNNSPNNVSINNMDLDIPPEKSGPLDLTMKRNVTEQPNLHQEGNMHCRCENCGHKYGDLPLFIEVLERTERNTMRGFIHLTSPTASSSNLPGPIMSSPRSTSNEWNSSRSSINSATTQSITSRVANRIEIARSAPNSPLWVSSENPLDSVSTPIGNSRTPPTKQRGNPSDIRPASAPARMETSSASSPADRSFYSTAQINQTDRMSTKCSENRITPPRRSLDLITLPSYTVPPLHIYASSSQDLIPISGLATKIKSPLDASEGVITTPNLPMSPLVSFDRPKDLITVPIPLLDRQVSMDVPVILSSSPPLPSRGLYSPPSLVGPPTNLLKASRMRLSVPSDMFDRVRPSNQQTGPSKSKIYGKRKKNVSSSTLPHHQCPTANQGVPLSIQQICSLNYQNLSTSQADTSTSQAGSSTSQADLSPSEASSSTSQAGPSTSQEEGSSNRQSLCCNFCRKLFHHRGDLRKHTRKHTKEKPFVCSVCQQKFSHNSNLIRHGRMHTEPREHACQYCGKRFFRKDKMLSHQRSRNCKKISEKKKH